MWFPFDVWEGCVVASNLIVLVSENAVELELGSTGAGDEGAKAMGAAVAQATQLRTLAMEACDIGPVRCGKMSCAKFVPTHPITRTFYPSYCILGTYAHRDMYINVIWVGVISLYIFLLRAYVLT